MGNLSKTNEKQCPSCQSKNVNYTGVSVGGTLSAGKMTWHTYKCDNCGKLFIYFGDKPQ